MKKLIRETAEEILQEYTNCYSEADEDCLVKMLEKLASNMAMEIFEEIENLLGGLLRDYNRASRFSDADVIRYATQYLVSELRKEYESEGADDE
jgi:hypothetical protein